MSVCTLCPRGCGVDRGEKTGFCGVGDRVKVARAALHFWEEPCISGVRGSGTVFFSGCTLGCVFCQNHPISRGKTGKEIPTERLAQIFSELQAKGAHNINLVTPMHFTPQILQALSMSDLQVPVVVNCGGYETVDTLRRWEGAADIYLPDLKFFDPQLSRRYSGAADYFAVASQAILEMHRQQPRLIWNGDMLSRGLIVRHLVLPGGWRDSLRLLDFLDANLPKDSFLLSLMSQFTPTPACKAYPEIDRRLTTYEYEKVAQRAQEMGFQGFGQDRRSAREEYTPPFDLEGV